jgi:hypothetical protein
MNQVLDGQTTALTFIHFRDETHEPGFLLPYAGVSLDGIFRFIIKLGMNLVLDGQTRALKFIHYRDETNEPGFLLPYMSGSVWTEFSGSSLNCG